MPTNKIKCGQNPLKIKDVNKNKFVDIFFYERRIIMCWKLYYLKIVSNEKTMSFDREFNDGELDLIYECNHILGDFNSFSDYYLMLNNNLKELKEYILKTESFKYRISSPIESKNIIIQINRKFINFASMFRTYLDYYEVQVKQIYGKDSDELKDFQRKCSNMFDNHFEYKFLCNLRHYCVHYKLPITKITQNLEDNRRIFYIEKERLQEWKGWKSIIKDDIKKLNKDIDIKQFILKVEKILDNLNKNISYYNTSEVLGAIRIMKKYIKANSTPYIVREKHKNGKVNFEIKNMIDDYFLAVNNILKLGIVSCGVYNKEYGFQFFDPFNMMFTKEEKEKLGLE